MEKLKQSKATPEKRGKSPFPKGWPGKGFRASREIRTAKEMIKAEKLHREGILYV